MRETPIMRAALLEVGGRPDVRLFRNNTGMAWVGVPKRQKDGSMLLLNPRPLHAGLCKGSADLIGIQRIVIRPEDVGRTIGRFVAIEMKADTDASEDQKLFLAMVQLFGGIGAVARSVAEAVMAVERELPL